MLYGERQNHYFDLKPLKKQSSMKTFECTVESISELPEQIALEEMQTIAACNQVRRLEYICKAQYKYLDNGSRKSISSHSSSFLSSGYALISHECMLRKHQDGVACTSSDKTEARSLRFMALECLIFPGGG